MALYTAQEHACVATKLRLLAVQHATSRLGGQHCLPTGCAEVPTSNGPTQHYTYPMQSGTFVGPAVRPGLCWQRSSGLCRQPITHAPHTGAPERT